MRAYGVWCTARIPSSRRLGVSFCAAKCVECNHVHNEGGPAPGAADQRRGSTAAAGSVSAAAGPAAASAAASPVATVAAARPQSASASTAPGAAAATPLPPPRPSASGAAAAGEGGGASPSLAPARGRMPSIRDVLGAAGDAAGSGAAGLPAAGPPARRLLPATRGNLVKFFRVMDVNHDGRLSVTEFVNACRDGVEVSSSAASSLKRQLELFAAIDKDGSGEVDVDEFVIGARGLGRWGGGVWFNGARARGQRSKTLATTASCCG